MNNNYNGAMPVSFTDIAPFSSLSYFSGEKFLKQENWLNFLTPQKRKYSSELLHSLKDEAH